MYVFKLEIIYNLLSKDLKIVAIHFDPSLFYKNITRSCIRIFKKPSNCGLLIQYLISLTWVNVEHTSRFLKSILVETFTSVKPSVL